MELIYKYVGDIVIKRRDDGTIDVWGKATGPDLDLDQQICDADWLADAMPAWLKSAGNVRAMHQPIAAGIGFELEEADQSWWLKSNIVDADSILKCEKRVYKGYSIGIANAVVVKDAAAPGGRIIKGDIVEVSLVDRPANPTALMDICKMTTVDGVETLGLVTKSTEGLTGASPETDPGVPTPTVETAETCPDCSAGIANDEACATCGGTGLVAKAAEPSIADEFGWTAEDQAQWSDYQKALFPVIEKKKYTDDERKDMAAKGEAMSAGGFPIKDEDDLKNAIQAIGRAKDPTAAKTHIKARAKALGLTKLIPDDWKAGTPELVKFAETLMAMRAITKGATPDEWMHDPTLLRSILAGLITCISQELSEMANGEDEIWDIEDLSYCLRIFTSWWENEAWEGEVPGPFDKTDEGAEMNIFVGLGVKPEILKVATDEASTDEQRAEARADIAKALGLGEVVELTALLKQATEGAKALEDRLAVVEEMSAPGGPALRSTAAQKMKSDEADKLREEAKKFMEAAAVLEDPERKRHYIGKAAQATRDADALERV